MAQVYLPERTNEERRPQRRPIPTSVTLPQDPDMPNATVVKTPLRPGFADIVVIIALIAVVALLVAGAERSASHVRSVAISLNPAILPLYAAYSFLRMLFAYFLSLIFTLVYGHIAATNERAARFMVPILDILQSIPILSFLPSVVLTLVALFPHSSVGVELAAIVLIFTSQAWNMTFSFYHSAKTIPLDLREAAAIYRLSPWRRFFKVEVSYGMIGLIWNSMMSWAGGWFFLMVAEQLTLGSQSFQLPGLGSFIQVAANEGKVGSLLLGLATLVAVIILMDLLFWRPLVAWGDKYKFENTRTTDAPESPILDLLRRSALLEMYNERIGQPFGEAVGQLLDRLMPAKAAPLARDDAKHAEQGISSGQVTGWIVTGFIVIAAIFGFYQGIRILSHLSALDWAKLAGFGGLTLVRTFVSMAIGLAWTLPLGVTIGMSPTWSRRLQPVVQVVASFPATAVFPILLIFVLRLPAGVEVAAILLMLLGTQWYMLFNVIAGAMAIPADLKESARIYQVNGWRRWRTLILPCVFPYLVTGLITASGGAWNASIVAEYATYNNKTYSTLGLGAEIARAAAQGNIPQLLAATLIMATIVVLINRFVWRRLYALADRRYALI